MKCTSELSIAPYWKVLSGRAKQWTERGTLMSCGWKEWERDWTSKELSKCLVTKQYRVHCKM